MSSLQTFGIWDYLILGTTVALSAAIGVYFRFTGGRQKTNEEYLMADRKMSAIPVAFSIMVSFVSAITLLGLSIENYSFGAQFIVINFGYGIATPIITQMYMPVFFRLQRLTAYEYLELRFGKTLRLVSSLAYTLQMILYNGVVLYAPAVVLDAVSSLDKMTSILTVGLICTFYATIGGMKAVLITDVLQSFLMYAAIVSVIIFASLEVGGLDRVFSIALAGGRLKMDNFSLDLTERNTWWSLVIGGMFVYLSVNATNHTQVQRHLTMPDLKTAQKSVWLSWPLLSIMSLSTSMSGLAIYAVYRNCDPYESGEIKQRDQLMPYYVMQSLRQVPGLAGLFIAGIFSASLSTVSAACNSLATVTIHDYIPLCFNFDSKKIPLATKLLACGYGIIFMLLAFIAEHLGGLFQAAFTIFGIIGGPLFAVFTLGMFTTFANEKGALVGMIATVCLTSWMSFGGPRPLPNYLPVSIEGCATNLANTLKNSTSILHQNPTNYFYIYRISYLWLCPIAFLCTIIIGSIVSVLWKSKQPWEMYGSSGTPDPNLFTPLLASRLRKKYCKNEREMVKFVSDKDDNSNIL